RGAAAERPVARELHAHLIFRPAHQRVERRDHDLDAVLVLERRQLLVERGLSRGSEEVRLVHHVARRAREQQTGREQRRADQEPTDTSSGSSFLSPSLRGKDAPSFSPAARIAAARPSPNLSSLNATSICALSLSQ